MRKEDSDKRFRSASMNEQNANMTTNSFKLLFTPMSDNDSAHSRKSSLSQKTMEMFRTVKHSIRQASAD